MRLTIGIERVLARGSERLRRPLLWPVWFSVDDAAVRYFTGDLAATDFLHAPGPAESQERQTSAAWMHRPRTRVLPQDRGLYGFGLLLTEGGDNDETVWQAYDELTSRIHALTLGWAAQASGLGPLFAGFGGSLEASPLQDHGALMRRLREGMAPADLDQSFPKSLLKNTPAFRAVGQVLARAMPRVADVGDSALDGLRTETARDPRAPKPTVTEPSSPTGGGSGRKTRDPQVFQPKPVDPQVLQPQVLDPKIQPKVFESGTLRPPLLDPKVFRPQVLDPQVLRPQPLDPQPEPPKPIDTPQLKSEVLDSIVERVTVPPLLDRIAELLEERLRERVGGGLSALEDGTVVAATVQAWQSADLPRGRALAIERALPAAASLRASLVLSGSIQLDV